MSARRKGSLHLGHGPKLKDFGEGFRNGSGIDIVYEIRAAISKTINARIAGEPLLADGRYYPADGVGKHGAIQGP
jgi:hypothetical protein